MKNKVVLGESIMIIVLAVIIGILLMKYNLHTEVNYVYLEYGDKFSGFEFYDTVGNPVDNSFFNSAKKPTVVLYLTADCSGCVDAITDFNRFQSVFGNSLNYIFLWENEIPENLVDKYTSNVASYTLNGKTKLSVSTPTYYIIDEENIVLFKDVERSNLIQKILDLDLIKKDVIRRNATQYIIDSYFDANQSGKPKLVYFYMPGCSDCQAADNLIKSEQFDKKYAVVYIYKHDSVEDNVILDKDKLFAKVYGVNWYPSFLLISDTNYKFVETANQEELESILNKF